MSKSIPAYAQITICTLVLGLCLQISGAGARIYEAEARSEAISALDAKKSLIGTSLELPEFLQLIAQGNVILIDTRPDNEYKAGHLPNALNLQVPAAAAKDLPPVLWRSGSLIFYGAGRGSPSASDAAVRMLELGVSNVLIYQGGWQEWDACRLPIAKGE